MDDGQDAGSQIRWRNECGRLCLPTLHDSQAQGNDPLGVGPLLQNQHKSIDANRQKVQDNITFATYPQWLRDRGAGITDDQLKARMFNVVDTDTMGGLRPLDVPVQGAQLGINLEELLKQEFRAASGATDSLQATITDATASEVSLAQNEAIRNVSVKAEIGAEQLIRRHLEVMHYDNVDTLDQPVNVRVNGSPERIYPSDLQVDVDFEMKITTDKDYKPKRLEMLSQMLQVLTSIRNEHPQKFDIDIMPFAQEFARGLGMDPNKVIRPSAPIGLPQGGSQGAPGAGVPQIGGAPNLPVDIVDTPAGPTLGSQ